MRSLDNAVQDLAVALEELSAKVELKHLGRADDAERKMERRHQAESIQRQASTAARELAGIIDDLKSLAAKGS